MGRGLGDNVRDHRRQAGWTQEELAHVAGISPSTVRKLEQGGSVRMETLHLLARALRVETSVLMSSGSPEPKDVDDAHSLRVMELRKVLMPPLGLDGPGRAAGDAPREEPNLPALRQATRALTRAYYEDDYGGIAETLPPLVRDIDTAVAHYDHGPEHEEALAIRIEALRMAGRYLTQVREDDLAYLSLAKLIDDARALGSELDAAAGVSGMCWLLVRQGRFEESARLAVATADRMEPRRISRATSDHLAVWGWVQLCAAAGAARNNQYDLAEHALRLAGSAAATLGREVTGRFQAGLSFGPVKTAMMDVEIAMVKGDARAVLAKAEAEALSPRARRVYGTPHRNGWYRHRLDIAMAHHRLGRHQEAVLELKRMSGRAPTWLRHQRMAKDVLRGVYRRRKRQLTVEMREMGTFLGVR
jgi:transcriptional regulator with XRE-family HTH domain